MAFGPITSWQIDGETVETVTDFILGGSKVTADSDCSHEIKRIEMELQVHLQVHVQEARTAGVVGAPLGP